MSNHTYNRWAVPVIRPDPAHPGATVSSEDRAVWAGATEPRRGEPSTGFELGDPPAPQVPSLADFRDPDELVDRMSLFWTTSSAAPAGPRDPDALVDEASRESFPASDAPAWDVAEPPAHHVVPRPATETRDEEPAAPAP